MLLNDGTLDGVRILSPRSVQAMLAPTWRFDGRNGARDGESSAICSYGLAAQQVPTAGCLDDLGTGGHLLVGHAGDAYGLKSGIWIDRARGLGIAYFVTGVPAKAALGSNTAFTAAETRVFRRTYALLPH
jgi:hypothetical protein